MTKVDYNLSSKLKQLKKLAETYFLAGHTPRIASNMLGLSEHILQEWYDDFIVRTLQGAAPKRVMLRELLLKNAPSMILILTELAKQKGDEKLSYSASSAVLSFASRFMQEDARILAAESKVKDKTGDDPGLKRTLFDFQSPDIHGASGAKAEEARRKAGLPTEEEEAEIVAAIERLEARGALRSGSAPAGGGESEGGTSSSESPEYGNAGRPEVDLFDGID